MAASSLFSRALAGSADHRAVGRDPRMMRSTPLLRLAQLLFAMPLQLRPPFIRLYGVVEPDLPAFQAPHDALRKEFGERILEIHRGDVDGERSVRSIKKRLRKIYLARITSAISARGYALSLRRVRLRPIIDRLRAFQRPPVVVRARAGAGYFEKTARRPRRNRLSSSISWASGSLLWASNPAEISTPAPGAKASGAGSENVGSGLGGTRSDPDIGGSGRLMILPAILDSPGAPVSG